MAVLTPWVPPGLGRGGVGLHMFIFTVRFQSLSTAISVYTVGMRMSDVQRATDLLACVCVLGHLSGL